MYFFVKDNNMSKTLDLADMIRKDPKGTDFTKSIVDAYKKTVTEIIKTSVADSNYDTILKLEKDSEHDWLAKAVNTVFEASRAINESGEIAKIINKDGFDYGFKSSTEVKMFDAGGDKEYSDESVIETKIVLKSGSSQGAEELFNILRVAFYGGEISKKDEENIDGEEVFVFNARRGFNQSVIDEAAEELQKFFLDNHMKEIKANLGKDILEELKNKGFK